MTRPGEARTALTITLTAVAGCVDAIGYLRLRHFFVSFMSGDSTKLVVSTIGGDWSTAASAGALVALFVAGVAVGRAIFTALKRWGRTSVLSIEALLLTLAALLGLPTAIAIALTVTAMGIQNAAVDKEQPGRMGLSYVTGTLVSFGEKLADALVGDRDSRWTWAPHLLHWLGLVLGAACGAVAYRTWGLSALLIPAVAAIVLACITGASAYSRTRSRA